MSKKYKKVTVRELFQHWLDTNQITQKQLDIWQGKVFGNKPNKTTMRTVGDIELTLNGRKPKARDVMKYLNKEGGLNWHLLDTVKIGYVNGKIEVHGYDGGHRMMAVCIVLGPDALIPTSETLFPTEDDIVRAFYKSNSTGWSKNVTKEVFAISVIRAGDDEGFLTEAYNVLKKDGETVIFEDDEIFEPAGNKPEYSVMVAPVEDMCKNHSAYISEALRIYKKAFAPIYKSNTTPKKVEGQILKALTFLLDVCDEHHLSKSYQGISNAYAFEEWLTSMVSMTPAKKLWSNQLAKENPHERMELRHLGVARGIWEKYCLWYTNAKTNLPNIRPKQEVVTTLYLKSLRKDELVDELQEVA